MDRDVVVTTAARALNVAVSLATSAITARVLGPAGRGEYFLAMTVAGTIVQVGNIGLASSNTYQVARDHALLGRLTGNSLVVAAASGLVGGVVAAALAVTGWWGDSGGAILWAVAIAPLSLFFLFGSNLLAGLGRFGEYNVFDVSSRLLVLASMGVAALWFPHADGFLAASVAVWLVVSMFLFKRLAGHAGAPVMPDRSLLGEAYHFAWRAYVVTMLGYLCLKASTLLLWRGADAEAVGQFSIASQVGDVLLLFPTSASLVLFPGLVRAEGDRWARSRRMMLQTIPLYGFGCLLAAFLFEPFVEVMYGSAYLPAVPVFWALLPGVFMLGAISIASQFLAAHRFPAGVFVAWGAGVVVASALAWTLVPRLGAVAAAWSVTGSHAVVLAIIAVAVAKAAREGRQGHAAPIRMQGGP